MPSDKTNFQNKILTKRQNSHVKQQIRRRKNSHWEMYVQEIYPKIPTKCSDSQTKQTNRGTDPIDGQRCGWTDIGKDRQTERHQDKTQTRQTYKLHLLFMLIYRYIYYERALIALKRQTSIAQAGHLDILCIQ